MHVLVHFARVIEQRLAAEGTVGHILQQALDMLSLKLTGPTLLVSTQGPKVKINLALTAPALVKHQLTLRADFLAEVAAGQALSGDEAPDTSCGEAVPRLILAPLRSWFLRLPSAGQREVLRTLANLQFHGSHGKAKAITDCSCGQADSLEHRLWRCPRVSAPTGKALIKVAAAIPAEGPLDDLLTRGLNWGSDPAPEFVIQDAAFQYRLNRVDQEQPLTFTCGQDLFTDGSAFHNRTPMAVGGGAAVQQTPHGWAEVMLKVPSSLPQEAATGEVWPSWLACTILHRGVPPPPSTQIVLQWWPTWAGFIGGFCPRVAAALTASGEISPRLWQ
jgi:hypothetical protein